MTLALGKAAVLGATGPTGMHLVRTLLEQGTAVRVVSRSPRHLERCFAARPAERIAADLLEPDATARAVEGCDVAFNCVGFPAAHMDRHPVAARSVARAIASTGARCVHVSSYWAYLPLQSSPLTETHPRHDGTAWMRHRRAAEDIHLEAGAAVVHLPDFYGPDVGDSVLQRPLTQAARGKTISWIGSADTPREYAFVPDAMATVARLARREEAYGERWIVPGGGSVTGRDVARIAGEALGREIRIRPAGPVMLRLVSLFDGGLRAFMQMVPEYVKPISYDAGKLEALLGAQPVTRYEEGIRRTLRRISGEDACPSPPT